MAVAEVVKGEVGQRDSMREVSFISGYPVIIFVIANDIERIVFEPGPEMATPLLRILSLFNHTNNSTLSDQIAVNIQFHFHNLFLIAGNPIPSRSLIQNSAIQA